MTKESTKTKAMENLESEKSKVIAEIPHEYRKHVTSNSADSGEGEEPVKANSDYETDIESNSEVDSQN